MPIPPEQQRRLFFALWPDDAVHQRIAAWSRQVCKHLLPESICWSVKDFVLAESVPSPDGVRYVVLERWTL